MELQEIYKKLAKGVDHLAPSEINDYAADAAKIFANTDKLKTAQLRNFYASLTKMRTNYRKSFNYKDIEMDMVMLKPKLAYAAGRQKAVRNHFYEFMKNAIDGTANATDQHKAVINFFLLVESVVAYHKFYGGE